jgi:hypothetical protein
MSSSTIWVDQPETDSIAGDRRGDRRYDVRLDMRWKLIRRRRVLDQGSGRTLDASSGGILFDAGKPLGLGLNVELSIAWPVLLHNVAPLQLVVTGKIVRVDGTRTAIRMTQHEFRTMGLGSAGRRPATASGAGISLVKPISAGLLSRVH